MMKEAAAIGYKSGIPKPYMKVTKMMFKMDEYLKCIKY